MLIRFILTALVAAFSFAFAETTHAEPSEIEKAKALFAEYVRREHAFDPAIAHLYSDDALIENTRFYPNGTRKKQTIAVTFYKQAIRLAMPLAKERRDRSTYSSVEYSVEGDRVRIKAQRYSVLKQYTSPMSLLVGAGKNGSWLIFEEISESRP